jgi:predicted naringenin-chalcone synthase
MTVGVALTQIIINWLIMTALFADGAANAVASGFKYVMPAPFTFNVPVFFLTRNGAVRFRH